MGPKIFLCDFPRAGDVTSRSMSRGSITVCYLPHTNSSLTRPRPTSLHLPTPMLSIIKSERLWLDGLTILRQIHFHNRGTTISLMLIIIYHTTVDYSQCFIAQASLILHLCISLSWEGWSWIVCCISLFEHVYGWIIVLFVRPAGSC